MSVVYNLYIKKPGIVEVLAPDNNRWGFFIIDLSYNWERSPIATSNESFSIYIRKTRDIGVIYEILSESFNFYTKPGEIVRNKLLNDKTMGDNAGIYIATTGLSYLNISFRLEPLMDVGPI
jgi:hypothetical protein